jgi:4-hydroxy-tetrahydrodipicolinate synthase
MRIEGIYPAVSTPFDAQGAIDYPAFGRLIDFLIGEGVSGIVPAGTTGEYYAISEHEREQLFRFVVAHTAGRVRLIAGCNAGSTAQSVAYATLARDLGYDGVMLPVPYTSLPSATELATHFRTVAQAVDLPVVLYNFPLRSGVEIGWEVFEALADQTNVIGVKEASGDMGRVYELEMRFGDRYQLICGSDDQALDYFIWGADAWIAGAATFLPRQHVELLEATRRGDLDQARTLMRRLLPVIRNMETGKYNQKTKYGAALAGMPVGDVRPPLLPLDEAEKDAFRAAYTIAVTTAVGA